MHGGLEYVFVIVQAECAQWWITIHPDQPTCVWPSPMQVMYHPCSSPVAFHTPLLLVFTYSVGWKCL